MDIDPEQEARVLAEDNQNPFRWLSLWATFLGEKPENVSYEEWEKHWPEWRLKQPPPTPSD